MKYDALIAGLYLLLFCITKNVVEKTKNIVEKIEQSVPDGW
ncbi:hypothetical protein ACSAZL_12795 [Methanosarcina sp. T3]